MSKHTPGPWTHTGREFNDVYDSDGQLIAVALHLRVGKPERSVAQTAANARLIAAAPDLLEALRGALEHWPVPSSICKDRPAWEAARTAIAKATGQA